MHPEQPEFSRPVRVDRLAAAGSEFTIEAEAAERKALADRFGLVELAGLTATLRLKPLSGGLVRMRGKLVAEVVQSCVVTLAPVAARVEESFDLTYAPAGEEEEVDEIELSLEAEDPPEPIVGGAIDMGEAVAEHLALALDPFPRAPGAEFAAPAEPDEPVAERRNPFAALAGWREKKR